MHELTSAAVALMVCVAAGSYLAGCCNGAIITSFLFYHDDIRKHGSHNAGLTNFYRVYGGKFAVCVILIDMLKAFVAVKLGSIVFGEYLGLRLEGEYFSALFCVIGHIFPACYSFAAARLAHRRCRLGAVSAALADDEICLARLCDGCVQLPGHDAALFPRQLDGLCPLARHRGAGHLGAPLQHRPAAARHGIPLPVAHQRPRPQLRNEARMIIDFHTHTFPDPIADAAIDRLSRQANITAYTCGTAAGLLLAERAAGVDRSIILPVATKPEQVHHINDYAAAHNKHAFVTNMFSFGCIHPDYEDWKQELDRLAAANMRGVKIHPAYQKTDLDDPKYLRILERAGTLGLIVVTHAGYDIGFPGCACCTPEKARSALRRVGPVKLVLAHMGGWHCWEQVPELLADTSALLDTSFSLGSLTPRDEALPLDRQMLSDEAFVSLVRAFGAERILFGSDCPWGSPQNDLQHIRRLPLTDEEKAAILGGNAKRLLGI